tara:strand:+ start:332 stop:721 length:390 start_codon:yes stop_codon:yes gene_type:complete
MATPTNMSIKVTRAAWAKMREILHISKNKYGFVYSATSGGCNGFNFDLGLLDKDFYEKITKTKFHTIIANKDAKLYVDPVAEMHLLGTKIDYVTEDFSKGHFENKFIYEIDKDRMTSCGCGVSFMPKNI